MELIPVECPKCKGTVHIDEDIDKIFCMYCRTEIRIKKPRMSDTGFNHEFKAKMAIAEHLEELYFRGERSFNQVMEAYDDVKQVGAHLAEYWLARGRFYAKGILNEFSKGSIQLSEQNAIIDQYTLWMSTAMKHYDGIRVTIDVEKKETVEKINKVFDAENKRRSDAEDKRRKEEREREERAREATERQRQLAAEQWATGAAKRKKMMITAAIAIVGILSTMHLFRTYSEVEQPEDIPMVEENMQEGFVGEFKGIAFAVVNQLHQVVSDGEEFLWLYASAGDNSSLIMLQVIDVWPNEINTEAFESIFDGMASAGANQVADAETLDIDFFSKGITFQQVISDQNHFGITYLIQVDEYLVLSVSYIHYEGEHTDLMEDFEFLLDHIWMGADPYEIAFHFSGLLENDESSQVEEGSSTIFGNSQEDIVNEIRMGTTRLAENYDGDITIISNVSAAVAPNLDAFIQTPTTIYTTLGSENGFMDTYMVVEGRVEEWFVHGEHTQLVISNDSGDIQFGISEPLIDTTMARYQAMLPIGTNVRMYFQYLGFSQVFDRAAGLAVAFIAEER